MQGALYCKGFFIGYWLTLTSMFPGAGKTDKACA